MRSIEDVYGRLKKYDTKNQLSISDDNKVLELKVSDNDKLVAFDDYVSIEVKGDEITHFHPDYNEMHSYFYNIMNHREKIPTKKEIRRTNFNGTLIGLVSMLITSFFCGLIGGFLGGLLFLPMFIIFVLICTILTSLPRKLVTVIRSRRVDKEDIKLMKKYKSMSYPSFAYAHDFYLTFDYIKKVSIKFLKQPKRINFPSPLEFSAEDKNKIEEIIDNREKYKQAEKLYEYYNLSLEAIKIINKYYDKKGNRKKRII